MMTWIFSKRALFYTVYIIIIIIKYYYTYKSLYVFLFNRFANMSDSTLLTEALAHNKLHVPTDKPICIIRLFVHYRSLEVFLTVSTSGYLLICIL